MLMDHNCSFIIDLTTVKMECMIVTWSYFFHGFMFCHLINMCKGISRYAAFYNNWARKYILPFLLHDTMLIGCRIQKQTRKCFPFFIIEYLPLHTTWNYIFPFALLYQLQSQLLWPDVNELFYISHILQLCILHLSPQMGTLNLNVSVLVISQF